MTLAHICDKHLEQGPRHRELYVNVNFLLFLFYYYFLVLTLGGRQGKQWLKLVILWIMEKKKTREIKLLSACRKANSRGRSQPDIVHLFSCMTSFGT